MVLGSLAPLHSIFEVMSFQRLPRAVGEKNLSNLFSALFDYAELTQRSLRIHGMKLHTFAEYVELCKFPIRFALCIIAENVE